MEFSATATTTVTVDRVNDAPTTSVSVTGNGTVANAGHTAVPIALFRAGEPAEFSVAELLEQLDSTDRELDPFGIGIVSADESNGVWQYLRTDIAGFEWTDFQLGDVGNVDAEPIPDGEVLLIDAETRLRFVPNDGATENAAIEFRIWDGTVGVASNPPSTIVDDSGGVAPFDTSSLSADSFAALVGSDKDGDGVADSADLDDDNDGILDTNEGFLEVFDTENPIFTITSDVRTTDTVDLIIGTVTGTFTFGTGGTGTFTCLLYTSPSPRD